MLNNRNTYLKIIAECSFARSRVSNKQIIHFANVSPATVTETTRILEKTGLVNRRRYTGVVLTEDGASLACQLLHKYRLCEVFLARQLHLPLTAIPEQAWAMAETLQPATAAALTDYLDHPQVSPFGGTLDVEKILDDTTVTRLSDVPVPATIVVTSYLENPDLVAYLQSIRLPLNVPLHVMRRDMGLNLLYLELPDQREITLNFSAATYLYTKERPTVEKQADAREVAFN